MDYNVTRNVKAEMNHDDWDIMILHYLGLDHIGHLEGPNSIKAVSYTHLDVYKRQSVHSVYSIKQNN